MIDSVKSPQVDIKRMDNTSPLNKSESKGFSSILSILSSTFKNQSVNDKTLVNSNQKTSNEKLSAEEIENTDLGEKISSLSKKLEKIKRKIEKTRKFDSKDIDNIHESIKEISDMLENMDSVDNKNINNILNVFSDIFDTFLGGSFSSSEAPNKIVLDKSISVDMFSDDLIQESPISSNSHIIENQNILNIKDSDFKNILDTVQKISKLLKNIIGKKLNLEKIIHINNKNLNDAKINNDNISNENINNINGNIKNIKYKKVSLEEISKLQSLFLELKEKLGSVSVNNEKNNINIEKIEKNLTLLEKSISVITKASIKQDSMFNLSTEEDIKKIVNTIKMDIKQVKGITKEMIQFLKKFKKLDSPQILDDSKELISQLDKLIAGFKKLNFKSSKEFSFKNSTFIEKEIQTQIKKVISIQENLSAIVSEAKLSLSNNGSVVNTLISKMEVAVSRLSAYYKKELKTINIKDFSKNSIVTSKIKSSDETPTILKITPIVAPQTTTKIAKEETFTKDLIKSIDLKIDMGEKIVLPKMVEHRFSNNTRRYDIINQVKKAMKTSFTSIKNGETKKMIVRLTPKVLGKVNIEIEMKDNNLTAKFKVETEVIKEILADSSSKLKDVLSSIGINIVNMNVDVNDKNKEAFEREKQETPENKRGDTNEKDREEKRDQKRHYDSEYEIVV